MYNLFVKHCRIYGIFNAIFFSLEIYFLTDHIIYGVLNPLKTELQFTVYYTPVCIYVIFFLNSIFPSLWRKSYFFMKKKNKSLNVISK